MQSIVNINRVKGRSTGFSPMHDMVLLKAVEEYKIENKATSVNWKTVSQNLKGIRNSIIDWSQLGDKQLQKRYSYIKNNNAKKLKTQNLHDGAQVFPPELLLLSDEDGERERTPASDDSMSSDVCANQLMDPAYVTSMGFRKRLLDAGITFRKFTDLLAQNSGKLPVKWLEKLHNYSKPPLQDECIPQYRAQVGLLHKE
ncbi:unnamed protein product [Orchesella dallaii]|uniref:Regulatory protein zeste n=1 Tax=Orchesella dallaii TaxID=48710 RepID=A0ABP1R5F9_9HEXA